MLDAVGAYASSITATLAEIDDIDLETAGVPACVHYRRLRRVYVVLCLQLISVIEENGEELREQLRLLLSDS